jgi:hypothetical protein
MTLSEEVEEDGPEMKEHREIENKNDEGGERTARKSG